MSFLVKKGSVCKSDHKVLDLFLVGSGWLSPSKSLQWQLFVVHHYYCRYFLSFGLLIFPSVLYNNKISYGQNINIYLKLKF